MKFTVSISQTVRTNNGLAAISIERDGGGFKQYLNINFDRVFEWFGIPHVTAFDFLIFSSVCYVIDKTYPRKQTSDSWTRDITLRFPVVEVNKWVSSKEKLEKTLSFLTGDRWELDFIKRNERISVYYPKKDLENPLVGKDYYNAVSLFSGGMDSLIGVINYLETDQRSKVLLVGHWDSSKVSHDQSSIFDGVKSEYPMRTDLFQFHLSQHPARKSVKDWGITSIGKENTFRSRSLVFIALGIYATMAIGANVPLLIPENGLIAVNLPLTPSRFGTLSTRTTHPYYLNNLKDALDELGINNTLETPLAFLTKGEAVRDCKNPTFLKSLVDRSVSCAHPEQRRWGKWTNKNSNVHNCGYCVPCIFRRASLHANGLDTSADYGFDIFDSEFDLRQNIARDYRAVLALVNRLQSESAVARELCRTNLLPEKERKHYIDVVVNGINEIRKLISEKDQHIRRENDTIN